MLHLSVSENSNLRKQFMQKVNVTQKNFNLAIKIRRIEKYYAPRKTEQFL